MTKYGIARYCRKSHPHVRDFRDRPIATCARHRGATFPATYAAGSRKCRSSRPGGGEFGKYCRQPAGRGYGDARVR